MRKVLKRQEKKAYSRPKLTTHGNVAKLTKGPVGNGPPSGIVILGVVK